MTENQIIESASTVGAHCNEDGRWVFEDDEHLVEFVLEILSIDRERRMEDLKEQLNDFLDGFLD